MTLLTHMFWWDNVFTIKRPGKLIWHVNWQLRYVMHYISQQPNGAQQQQLLLFVLICARINVLYCKRAFIIFICTVESNSFVPLNLHHSCWTLIAKKIISLNIAAYTFYWKIENETLNVYRLYLDAAGKIEKIESREFSQKSFTRDVMVSICQLLNPFWIKIHHLLMSEKFIIAFAELCSTWNAVIH